MNIAILFFVHPGLLSLLYTPLMHLNHTWLGMENHSLHWCCLQCPFLVSPVSGHFTGAFPISPV